jgi:hypothetical protein
LNLEIKPLLANSNVLFGVSVTFADATHAHDLHRDKEQK